MEKLIAKPTQCQKVLKILEDADGDWVSGREFIQKHLLSQFHARVFELQRKGYKIEASEFTDEFGFKSYRLIRESLFDK